METHLEILKRLLSNWDTAIVDLNRNKGMFKANNVRLRNCSLHYNKASNEYYVRHGSVTYGVHDIYNIRLPQTPPHQMRFYTYPYVLRLHQCWHYSPNL